ncbi:tetratricopeptide repeat protein [Bryobacter aggregatus]|uniref:tetratricopeptide repeat protein n=1 Tax=Bryobacter aggregatus TaxID=360054 RepID=UPI0004E1748A|nr:tetratricopeptide repeat protein [Bryobacter aggregatus]
MTYVWTLVGVLPLSGQIVLQSPHFTLYSSSRNSNLPEKALLRLEELHTALPLLESPEWRPTRPQRVWVTGSSAEWKALGTKAEERGSYRSGLRKDWIVVNSEINDFLQVLSHEYVHAVLNRASPDLPLWLEEGICEYYSTLDLRYGGNRATVSLGRPPGNRLAWLRGIDTIDLEKLSSTPMDQKGYALSWAAASKLWPDWSRSLQGLSSVKARDFEIRSRTIPMTKPVFPILTLTADAVAEMEAEFQSLIRGNTAFSVGGRAAEEAQALFLEGLRLSDEGESQQAIGRLEKACQLRPSNSSWWLALALAYREGGQRDRAKEAVARAVATAVNATESAAAESFKKSFDP